MARTKQQEPDPSEFAVDAVPQVSDDTLATISRLAAGVVQLQRQVKDAEAVVKQLKEQLLQAQDVDLPTAMAAAGMSSFTLTDGSAIEVAPFIQASLSEGNKKPAAIAWLKKMGNDALITTEVIAVFKKGETADAAKAQALLVKKGWAASLVEDVNTSSFKAFVRERINADGGKDIPFAEIGVYHATRATVKVPKQAA